MLNSVFELFYKNYMLFQGYKLIGHSNNLYYGVNKVGEWQFYLVYKFSLIPISHSDNRTMAEFTYKILMNDLKKTIQN